MINRLTIRPDIGLDEIWFANSDDPEGAYTIRSIAECERYDILDEIAARLAEYEDTGFTPHQVRLLAMGANEQLHGRLPVPWI